MNLLSFFIPYIAHAEGLSLSVKEMIYRISYYIVNPLIQVGFGISLVYLVWKIILYIKDRNSGYTYGKKGAGETGNAIDGILWALFGLFIMSSAFFIMRNIAGFIGSTVPTP